jgi:hypothetical protein
MTGTSNYHAAVYLGKDREGKHEMVHISSDPEKKDKEGKKSFLGAAIATKKAFGARITG